MRFVSNSARLLLGNYRNAELAVSPATVAIIDGRSRAVQSEPYVVSQSVPIQFSQEGLLSTDVAAAKAHWAKWPGNTLEEDGVTPTDPTERIGMWDSFDWQGQYGLTDEDREAAEKMLLSNPALGQHYIVVEKVAVAKPWNTYDSTHHSKVAALAEELGCVNEALAYEQANKNRPTVVAALEGTGNAERPDGELISA